MLETFLQVLMDEEFLDQLAVSAGRVLVIDPEEVSRCELAPPLMGMGYEVAAMPDVRSAEAMLGEFDPNMIILSVADSGDKALWFCERLKSDAKTAAIPILVVVEAGRDRLAVKALRAGADDYVARPVNTELLYIKVQNYLRITNPEPKECGVSGSLDEMSFTDMIQILCAGRRNVDILLDLGTRGGARLYP